MAGLSVMEESQKIYDGAEKNVLVSAFSVTF